MLKVLLIVVQGKPEGKTIPLVGPVFRVGRGEDCHLRPNSEEVSRRHCEVTITDSEVIVRDLGSRNGTKVNGKAISQPHFLKSGELLQIGPLTFAVAIQGQVAAAPAGSAPAAAAARAVTSLDDAPPPAEIETWLVSDNSRPTPDRPSSVYDGDTLTIDAYREGSKPKSSAAVPKAPEPAEEPAVNPFEAALEGIEQLPDGVGDGEEASAESADPDDPDAPAPGSGPDEMVDESNPFHAGKKGGPAVPEPAAAKKAEYKDTSDAANDILRRMLDRRRGAGKA